MLEEVKASISEYVADPILVLGQKELVQLLKNHFEL